MPPTVSGTRSELGGYRLEALLARSGASLLFRARGIEAGEEVVIEVPREGLRSAPGFVEEMRRQAVEAAALQHPKVAKTAVTGVEEGVPYTVAPDPNGVELTPLVEGLDGLSLARATAIVTQVAEALAAAHRAGLVHGTLEPARVLVTHHDGVDDVLLTGFGFCPPPGSDGTRARPFGLPVADFASPEQIRGEAPTPASDVYALGCLLHHTLVAAGPAPGPDEAAKLEFHLHGSPAPIGERAPELPAQLDGVLARALAKDPAERYASPDDLAADLRQIAGPGRAAPTETERKRDTTQRWKESVEAGAHQWSPSKPVIAWPQAGSAEVSAVPPAEDVETSAADAAPPAVEWPQPPPADENEDGHDKVARHPRRSGGRTAARVLAALVALAAVAAVVVLVATGGDDSDSSGSADKASTPPPAKKQQPESPPPKQAGALATWPKRDAYTVVVFVSADDRAGAEARARQAAKLNLRAGVLDSGDYPNLPEGQIVGFAGVFDSQGDAEKAAQRLKDAGVARSPYVRRIQGS